MESVDDVVAVYQLELTCLNCDAKITQAISWLRAHTQMMCPTCDSTMILDAPEITAAIHSVEEQMAELDQQLKLTLKAPRQASPTHAPVRARPPLSASPTLG